LIIARRLRGGEPAWGPDMSAEVKLGI